LNLIIKITCFFSDHAVFGNLMNTFMGNLARRDFLGLAGGSALASVASRAFADSDAPLLRDPATSGKRVHLRVESRTIEVNGKSASVLGIVQPNGIHGLYTDVETPFHTKVENHLSEQTLVHWHGIKDPFRQDGVPHISAPPIHPGNADNYDFPFKQTGTYWMHSHDGLQLQRMEAAPLIIHDKATRAADVQEIVVMLHDFTFADPRDIFAQLKKGHGKNVNAATHSKAASVKYDAYLANDRTLDDPQVVPVAPNGRIRLRIINASASTNYWVHTGSLHGTLIAVDGSPVHPISANTIPLSVAQRADVMVTIPSGGGGFPIIVQAENRTGRTGIILATSKSTIKRISVNAKHKSPKIGFHFERQLAAAHPRGITHADIQHKVALTGDIKTYVWKMRHQAFPHVTPVMVKTNATVELIMHNHTAMSHPMHLHGHRFQVVGIDQDRFSGAVRDTVLVPPNKTVTIAFHADNTGRWAYHCHNLYHQMAGMMTILDYKGIKVPYQPPQRI
jgi:FtsP/CotA-like multicopper oxidase with cupredoxin domain